MPKPKQDRYGAVVVGLVLLGLVVAAGAGIARWMKTETPTPTVRGPERIVEVKPVDAARVSSCRARGSVVVLIIEGDIVDTVRAACVPRESLEILSPGQ